MDEYQLGVRTDERPEAIAEPGTPTADVAEAPTDLALDTARHLLSSAESELGAIEQAIERLGLGTHSACAVCGGPIEPELLIASPTARRCAAHAAGR